MKKVKQILAVLVLVFCCSMVVKADTQAAEKITGVKQTKDATNGVAVSCDAAGGSTQYYYVEWGESLNDYNTWLYDIYSDPNNIVITGLSAGKTYYVSIAGVDASGEQTTELSEPLEVVTAPQLSSITAVQSGASTNGATVNITAAGTGVNYYTLSFNNSIIGQGTSPNVTTSVLQPGIRYTNVIADACRRSSAGYIAYGSLYRTMTVTTLQNKINKSNFGVSSGNLKSGSYTFAVNSTAAADGYEFEFKTTSGAVKKTLDTKGKASVSTSGLNGTFYQYRVRSYVNCSSGKVCSAWSDVKTLAVAKSVKGKLQKGNKVKVSWKKVSGASGYVIYASDKNSGYKKVKSLSSKKTSIVISKIKGKKLKKGKTYYIRVVPKAKKLGNAEVFYTYSGTIVTKYR